MEYSDKILFRLVTLVMPRVAKHKSDAYDIHDGAFIGAFQKFSDGLQCKLCIVAIGVSQF